MAPIAEVPAYGGAFKFPLDASPEPERPDAFVGQISSVREATPLGDASTADGLDCHVPMNLQEWEDKVTGDSWEPDALTAHVRF